MKTAIITGASAGLGEAFVRQAALQFPEIECFWLIARREERLRRMAETLAGKETVCLPLDLCKKEDLAALEQLLSQRQPEVRLLINNAGCGYLGNVGETETALQTRMTELNVTALTAVTAIALPYMPAGSHIVNVSSIASFCPNPRMTVYSATKAYVSAFTRGISEELQGRGVTATAVCPGPMRTEFLETGGIAGNSKTFQCLPYCVPEKVAAGTLRAAKAGKVFYTPTGFYRFYRVVAKILPQRWMVKLTKT
ncbi:MAG: SDR family NAD(P)-dependent oxidoreductase [Oscillospiraceae bacterium]